MDTEKSRWLDARRNVITENYTLPADEQARVDDMFSRMEQLASECANQGEFESRLGASPLAGEYGEMFTRITKYSTTAKEMKKAVSRNQTVGIALGSVSGLARTQARGWLMQQLWKILPNWCYDLFVYRWYNIPVIGSILSWRNRKSYVDDVIEGITKNKEGRNRRPGRPAGSV